jgi:hypothetical protein
MINASSLRGLHRTKKLKVNQKSFPKIIILNSLPLIIINRFMAENIENNKSMVK